MCLTCGKELKFAPEVGEKYDQVDDGGNVEIRFHFGSVHDMCFGFNGNEKPAEAYICDDCFGSEIIQQRLRKPNPAQEKLNYLERLISNASGTWGFTPEEEVLYLKEIMRLIEERKENADT